MRANALIFSVFVGQQRPGSYLYGLPGLQPPPSPPRPERSHSLSGAYGAHATTTHA